MCMCVQVCVCVCVHVWHRAHTEVRRELVTVVSLLPYGSLGVNSGSQAWQQKPLPPEPSLWPNNFFLKTLFYFCKTRLASDVAEDGLELTVFLPFLHPLQQEFLFGAGGRTQDFMCIMQASYQPFDCAMFPAPRQRTSKQHVFNSELRCPANPAWFTSQPPFPYRRRSRNTGANSCVISWAFTHRYLKTVWRQRNGVPALSSGGQKPDNKVLAGQWPLRGIWGKIFLSLPSLNAPGTGLCS